MDYDFISIGDIATDAFIRIKEASVHCDINKEKCEICIGFADKIPYEEVYVVPAVGNSANASVAASRLGLTSTLVSNLGDDYFGQECLVKLKKENVSAEFITVHKDAKTNYHYVLWYEDDRSILIKHEKYDYQLPNIGSPKWIYLSSLGADSMAFQERVEEYLEAHNDIKLVFQPGTFQMKSQKLLDNFCRRAEIFFCNKEEAQRILKTTESDFKKLLELIKKMGPKIVVITEGKKGAYAHSENNFWFMPPYPDPKPPLERTGAGDAFSSTFTVAMALGKTIEEALRWAPINSMSVVQYVGSQKGLLTVDQIEKFLEMAPDDYRPQRI
ncbi:carbohydrate kinase family protein [Candidatus Azambacteria bacterium]|nr:carbohydrate kinase family protein [Candidatus Azambacteria bacterium]